MGEFFSFFNCHMLGDESTLKYWITSKTLTIKLPVSLWTCKIFICDIFRLNTDYFSLLKLIVYSHPPLCPSCVHLSQLYLMMSWDCFVNSLVRLVLVWHRVKCCTENTSGSTDLYFYLFILFFYLHGVGIYVCCFSKLCDDGICVKCLFHLTHRKEKKLLLFCFIL